MTDDFDTIRLSDVPEPLVKAASRIAQHVGLDGEPVLFRYQVEMLAREQADWDQRAEAVERK